MKRTPKSPDRIAPVLQAVLRRFDSEQQLEGYRIWVFWNNEVGATIARRAQPLRLRNGILFVTVSSHSWMQELQFMKDDLRERLNARLGSPLVRDIYFVSGHIESAPPEEVAMEAQEEQSAAVESVTLPPLDNPQLAAAFDRLALSVARQELRRRRTN
ncbi:MAG: DUF721 domain-containing protein [Deltaproteobacteria bacterium]|nr:DUF721 domain-containing protein [Deltaproteobacteria bacterium]